VIAMRHLTPAERAKLSNKKDAVIITVELDDGIPPLPTDVTATLSADTLLAPKFVALSAGTPGGKTLANNAAIEDIPLTESNKSPRGRTAFRKRKQAVGQSQPDRDRFTCDLGDFMPSSGRWPIH